MVLRKRVRTCIQIAAVVAGLGFLSLIVHSWNAFSHRELDEFVQDGKRYILRKKADVLVDGGDSLEDAFRKADENSDGFLTAEEIEKWIVDKTQKHLDEGEGELSKIFTESDVNRNAVVSWDEFQTWYKAHPSSTKKNDLSSLREEWDVADSDRNAVLNQHEFLCFRHPELCKETLLQLTKDVFKNLDKNNDGKLSEEEYTAPPPGQVEEGFQDYETRFKEQRRKEFLVIDANQDGWASPDELGQFLNPRNHIHAKTEADELIDAADENQDGRLSLEEVQQHRDLFEQSKLMNVDETFHNDF
ncbi:45 kDa calcium-binding protein-like [Paramacrobiotus metropolitanus]|uniref:45 kDa calcium-binding protein-like n=1 Tax=Paramacrobiotus metropolitanus TaxID=2943436 RepID=UPI0024456CC7|nr:45 kDa calcium-binding protein-like [Paramacrobiotus metropolitanus]